MLRFRLFGIPFEIAPFFWLGSAMLGAGVAQGPHGTLLLAVWVACVLVSIVIHELGHALAARRAGVEPAVELHGIGGLTRMYGRPLTREEGFWVSLAGPAAGFGLFLVVRLLQAQLLRAVLDSGFASANPLAGLAVVSAVEFLVGINLYWTIFNMLPVLPLDGGQVLRNLLGPRRLNITQMVGVFVAGSVTVLAALRGQYFIAVFLGYLTYMNLRGDTRALPGGTSQ